jgi:hypothetical protein
MGKKIRADRICLGALLLLAAGTASAAAQQHVGCWQTAQDVRDYRQLCIMPDLRVHVSTFRTGSGGRCFAYQVPTAKLTGSKLTFDVAAGKGNCLSKDGTPVNSVSGSFRCEFKGADTLACATAWQGWDPIDETYRRR